MANGTAAAERKKGRMRLILNKFQGNSEADVENFKPNYDLDVFLSLEPGKALQFLFH